MSKTNGRAFKKRHVKLVKSHMNHKQNSTNGLNLLIKDVKGFSQAQNAWRFYNNENVDIKSLNDPIMQTGLETIEKECSEYLLVAHDWSLVNYRNHTTKDDCIETKRSNSTNAISKGYDLQSSLAISDKSGEPITPLIHNLKTKDKIYSTYDNSIDINHTHLNELSHRITYINNELNINKKIVHIIDREADSVGFFRALQENDYYIVRALDRVSVEYEGKTITQKELAKTIKLGEYVKTIEYKKKQVKIYVNSVDIDITRDTYVKYINDKGKVTYKKEKGRAIKSRFVVERLIDSDNNIVATWLLLSNLKEDVDTKTIGLWYYYRWNIETYFKLLKSSGFNLEKWQQESSKAIFKRLLITSYACLLVWQIEHSSQKNILEIKTFLVKLSGRLVARGKVSTSPALLAGIWSFFSTMDILELYDIEKLSSMKKELNEFLGMDF